MIKTLKKGYGRPKILILSGIHGDENSAVKLSRLLYKKLVIKGTLTVISVANVSAFKAKKENSPIDNRNLNRCFPGKNKGSYTYKLARSIFKLCLKQDLIIDIHNFQNDSPFLIVLTKIKSTSLRKKLYRLVKIFKPDLVWEIDSAKQKKFRGSLVGELINNNNKIAIGIELPHEKFINKTLSNLLVNKIEMMITNLNNKFLKKRITVVERYEIKSQKIGKIISLVTPLNKVEKNKKIGLLITESKKISIKSPISGIIIETSNKPVKDKEKIFTIGKIKKVL